MSPQHPRRTLLWWSGTILLTLAITALLLARSELSSAAVPQPCVSPSIHIIKDSGELIVTCSGKRRLRVLATFGGQPAGHKLRSGDQRTPEGQYHICTKHRSHGTYKFLGIDYPSAADAKAALKGKRISAAQHQKLERTRREGHCPSFNTPLGGAIGIHGVKPLWAWGSRIWSRLSRIGGLHRYFGFTDGCIAVTNEAVDRIWSMVEVGTPVHIHPVVP